MTEQNSTEQPTLEQEIFELTDVTVDTMGLVDRGAIQQDFFLLKNEDGSEDDDAATQPPERTILEKIGLARLVSLVREGLSVEGLKQEAVNKILGDGARRGIAALLNSYGDELPEELKAKLQAAIDDTDTLTDEDDEVEETAKAMTDEVLADSEQTVDAASAADEIEGVTKEQDMSKNDETLQEVKETEGAALPDGQVTKAADEQAEIDVQAEIAKRDEQLVELTKRLDDMAGIVEKSQQEATEAKAKANVERQARLLAIQVDVAKGFDNLAADSNELGEFLHYLKELDARANVEKSEDAEDKAGRYGYVMSLLEAANEQVSKGALFAEKGSSDIDETVGKDMMAQAAALVEKGDYKDIKEALLAMPDDMAQEYISNVKPQ